MINNLIMLYLYVYEEQAIEYTYYKFKCTITKYMNQLSKIFDAHPLFEAYVVL